MFAKILDVRTIQRAPRSIYIGDTTIVNPTAEQYAEAGWYEVFDNFNLVTETVQDEEGNDVEVTNEEPAPKWYHYVDKYEEQEADTEHELQWIEHTHELVKDPQPIYGDLIVRKIRTTYSLNDELALQRQQNNSDEKKAEFDAYNEFCNACKAEARAEIEEWEEA